MAKTRRAIILSIVQDWYDWISPGELFREAQVEHSYRGSQEDLIKIANELSEKGEIESRERGRMQNTWYRNRIVSDSTELDDKALDAYSKRGIRFG